jgi:hypothetical protein
MSDEINTAVPLALHPGVLETVGEDFQADPVVSTMRDALGTAHASFQATVVGHRKIMADPTHTEAANLQRSASAAARRQDEALRRLDGAVERCNREIGFINDTLSTPEDPPAPYVTSLIADRMSAMTQEERHKVISEAMRADDRATLGAVLFCGPAWVFGLSDTERQMYRHSYLAERYPAALARKAALERAVELVKNGGQSLMTAHAKLFDQKRLDDAAARARQAEEALSQ